MKSQVNRKRVVRASRPQRKRTRLVVRAVGASPMNLPFHRITPQMGVFPHQLVYLTMKSFTTRQYSAVVS